MEISLCRFKQLSFSVVSPSGSSRLAACFRSFAALLARLNRQADRQATQANHSAAP